MLRYGDRRPVSFGRTLPFPPTSARRMIVEPTGDNEISRCFGVMAQLRPHLDEPAFLERVRRQMTQGYRLAARLDGDRVVAVAGYRFGENLVSGRHLYVDDLVTDAAA